MGWFENTFVCSYHLQTLMWKRYIDDIFIIWQHGKEELLKFIKHLNLQHTSIKFTEEISNVSINYLDITII